MLNKIDPDLLDMRTLNKDHPLTQEKQLQNMNLIWSAAVGITRFQLKEAEEMMTATSQQRLEVIWVLLHLYFKRQISPKKYPELLQLAEDADELKELTLEEILTRWVNYHL